MPYKEVHKAEGDIQQLLLSQARVKTDQQPAKPNETKEEREKRFSVNFMTVIAERSIPLGLKGDVNGVAQVLNAAKPSLTQMGVGQDQVLKFVEDHARRNNQWNDKFAETLRAAAIISGFGTVAKQNEFTTHQNTTIDPVAKQAAILAQLTALQETINRTINSIKEGLSKEETSRLTSEESREESKAKKKREERNA